MAALSRPRLADSPDPGPGTRCAHCEQPGTLKSGGRRILRCNVCGFVAASPRNAATNSQPREILAFSPLAPGSVLRERYKLTEPLGQGAHGLTFLAEHLFLNHPCVVKILPQRIHDASDAAVRRLRTEASAGYTVNHANVVRVLDCDVYDDLWYFVMEFVDGVDLGVVANEQRPIDWRQGVRWALDAANGLQAIHEAGLVHRDVKPSNLILGMDGRVRVADLGVVHVAHDQAAASVRAWIDRAGSLAYTAPEILDNDGAPTARSDLYALGATLFHLLTGAAPHAGAGLYERLLRAKSASVEWPKTSSDDTPPWLRAAVLKLLDCRPERRFASAAELVASLQRTAAPPAPVVPLPSAEQLQPRGVVVLPFEREGNEAGHDWLGYALADHLGRALANVSGVYVADREQFLDTLERVAARSARPRPRQLLSAGRLLGAGTIITGRFLAAAGRIEFAATCHTVQAGAPATLGPVQGDLTQLAELETLLFSQLCSVLGLRPDAAVSPSPAAPVLAAQEAFFSGKRAFLRGDYETALEEALQACELDPAYGEAIGFAGVCCARMGRYEEAAEYNRQQEALALQSEDRRLEIEAYANRGSMHYFRGDYEAAQHDLSTAARRADALGLPIEAALISNNLGFVLMQLGRHADAEENFRRSVETHRNNGALISLIGPYNGLGNVLRAQQRYEEACGYFRRALTLAQESEDRVNVGVAYLNLGQCALLEGRLADAKHELALALTVLEDTSFWNGLARVYESMTELNLRVGNKVEAIRCAERRVDLARRHKNRRLEAAAWRQQAEALRSAQRTTEADECAQRAAEIEAQPAE